MALTILEQQIQTRLPNGTNFETWLAPWSEGKHRMGELKRITIEYNLDEGLPNYNLYVNPALFVSGSAIRTFTGKGDVFYAIQMPSVVVPSQTYNLSIQSQLPFVANLEAYDNCKVYLVPDDDNVFTLYIEFHMILDMQGYLSYSPNKDKLLKDYKANTNVLTPNNSNIGLFNFTRDVYGDDFYEPRVYLYAEDSTNTSVNFFSDCTFPGFKAGWYFKNPEFAQPDLSNQYFVIKRNSVVSNKFSPIEINNVEVFTNTDIFTNPINKFVVGIIRVDALNDSMDYLNNYDADWQVIEASNTSTSKIQAPMTNPTHIGANQYKATFNVSNLVIGAKYRLIGIAYSFVFGEPKKVNSFISHEIVADGVPCFDGNGLDFTGTLSDYQNEYTGNDLECVVEERMRSEIKLDFAFNKWKNDLFTRLGIVGTNDIRRYLEKIEIEFYNEEFYTIFSNIRNVYDYKVINKTGFNTYSTQQGMTINFASNYANFIYEWRNRFENNINCLSSSINNIPIAPQSTQFWGGKTIKIKWTFTFTYDDYLIPFSDKIVYEQKIRVKGYQNRISVAALDEDDIAIEKTSYCKGNDICVGGFLTGSVTDPDNQDFKLISNIKPIDSNVDVIKESEAWQGDEMNQLQQIDLTSQDEDFYQIEDDMGSTFCVKTDNLLVNSQYEISVIAKKYSEAERRVTEDESPRITENNNQLLID
jgi:hypothetical protein